MIRSKHYLIDDGYVPKLQRSVDGNVTQTAFEFDAYHLRL